jgi:TonB family protein
MRWRLTKGALFLIGAVFWVSNAPAAEPAKPATSACSKSWSTKLNGFDQPPDLLSPDAYPYPRRAEWEKVGGKVVISIDVSSEGQVTNVTILCTEAPGYFEGYVEKVIPKWEFGPAQKAGQPIAFSGYVVTLEFDPKRLSAALRFHPVIP